MNWAAEYMYREEEFINFLKHPNTTLEMVQQHYQVFPRLSGHMVEDLVELKKTEHLDFLASVNWFCMGGRLMYERLYLKMSY